MRQKVFAQVNTALIDLYQQVDKTISQQVQAQAWSKGIVAELAGYIAQNAPHIKALVTKTSGA